MAGLSVVLEPHKNGHQGKPPAQIISKATLVIHGPKHKQVPPSPPATAASSFLHCCYLCHMELAEGRDIYMYRGDRAFCSEECRYRQIFMDVDAGSSSCGNGAGAGTTRGSWRVAGGGRVAY